MNIPIRRVIIVMMVMIAALIANATYVQVFKADKLRANPNNQRVLLDEYARQRGQITAGGDVIAASVKTDDRLKYLRTYPTKYAAAYAPITGYYSYTYASSGLEQAEDAVLNGNDDRLFGQRFIDMFSGRDPRGGNVITTINPKMQQAAWDGMRRGCDGGCRGAVVALDPKTGAVLTMVSTPSFDPNGLASHDGTVQQKTWIGASPNDPTGPLVNRALRQTYPPGSTFKVVTTAAALQQGVDPNTSLTAANSIVLPNTQTSLTNYGNQSCPGSSGGRVTLQQAFQYSCNTAFVELSTAKLQNPIGSFKDTASKFGVGASQPGVPMSVVNSEVGDVSDLAALGQSSIGQRDVRVTPMQNAMIAATVANGGVRMQPYLVDKIQSPDLKTLHTTKPTSINEPVSQSIASALTSLMIDSERHTSGSGGPIQIASKTGTAEHSETSNARDTPYAWYIAFGPSTDARVAVAVIVENGDRGLQATGGSSAAPIGRAVINAGTGN